MPGYKSITGMTGMGNARELAEMLRQLGRGRDTVLAHITPEEAQMLRDQGGSGTINPDTGLPEFQEEGFDPDYDLSAPAYQTPEIRSLYPGMTPIAGEETFYGEGGPFTRPAQPIPEAPPPSEVDIGFGPGRFTQERFEPVELRGATPEQMERFLPTPTLAQRAESKLQGVQDIMSRYPRLTEALGVGAQGIVGAIQAGRTRQQGREAAARLSELGRPLREEAENLRRQALAGTLTPQQAREQEIARARARQGATQRGATTGTQAAMIENQLARQRAELSQTNLNNALRQLNLANAYDEAAIKATIQADREADELLADIYQNIAFSTAAAGRQQQRQQQPPRQRPTVPEAPEVTRRPEIPRGQ